MKERPLYRYSVEVDITPRVLDHKRKMTRLVEVEAEDEKLAKVIAISYVRSSLKLEASNVVRHEKIEG